MGRYKILFAGMFSTALAFAIAIPLGLWLRPRWPAVSDDVFGILLAIVLVGIALGMMRLLAGPLWPARKVATGVLVRPDPDFDIPRTGYELSLEDFRRLISDPESQPTVAALLRDWYRYEVSGEGSATAIRSAEGHVVGVKPLHTQIQMDPAKQRSIYGVAMDFWR